MKIEFDPKADAMYIRWQQEQSPKAMKFALAWCWILMRLGEFLVLKCWMSVCAPITRVSWR